MESVKFSENIGVKYFIFIVDKKENLYRLIRIKEVVNGD